MNSSSKYLVVSCLLLLSAFYLGYLLSQKTSRGIYDSDTVIFQPAKSPSPELKFIYSSFCDDCQPLKDNLFSIADFIDQYTRFVPLYQFQKITNLPEYCQQSSLADKSTCLDENQYLKSSQGIYYTSPNGRTQASQNVRELCAWQISGNNHHQWWKFVRAISQQCTLENVDNCWEQYGQQSGYDTNKITKCFNLNTFDIINNQIEASSKLAVTKPSIFFNDNIYPAFPNKKIKINNIVINPDQILSPFTLKLAICAHLQKPGTDCQALLSDTK